MSVSDARDQFAVAHGYETYAALVEASAPLPTDESANWHVTDGQMLVAVDGAGRWFAWNETTMQESVAETVVWGGAAARGVQQAPQAVPAPAPVSVHDLLPAMVVPALVEEECHAH